MRHSASKRARLESPPLPKVSSKSTSGFVVLWPSSRAVMSVLNAKPPRLKTNLLSSKACAGDWADAETANPPASKP
jgi:hypothetical protein